MGPARPELIKLKERVQQLADNRHCVAFNVLCVVPHPFHTDLISLTPLMCRALPDPPTRGWYDFRMVRREMTLPWRWVSTCRMYTAHHTSAAVSKTSSESCTACVPCICVAQTSCAIQKSSTAQETPVMPQHCRPRSRSGRRHLDNRAGGATGCCGARGHLALLIQQDVLAADPGHGLAVRHLVSRHRRQRACTGLVKLSLAKVMGTGSTDAILRRSITSV